MKTEVLVVGQGICGTWLSFFLEKAGIDYLVIDNGLPDSPSRVASGIINPITGRRLVKTWLIEELLPFAATAYMQLGKQIDQSVFSEVSIIDFPTSAQMAAAYEERIAEEAVYLSKPAEEDQWASLFSFSHGVRKIHPALLIHLSSLLGDWKQHLKERDRFRQEPFQPSALQVEKDGVRYQDLSARKIIFCDGLHSLYNPWFYKLPFAPNKGEALWIRTAHLPMTHLFKKGISLVPLAQGLYWVGSSHEWDFQDTGPTEAFRVKTEAQLKSWLKAPFEVVDHRAAVRPATLERRPFVGLHPVYSAVGILNGMGTKGCSLAPYFANQLVNQLTGNSSIHPEADVHRFRHLLARP